MKYLKIGLLFGITIIFIGVCVVQIFSGVPKIKAGNFMLYDSGDLWFSNVRQDYVTFLDSSNTYAISTFNTGQDPMAIAHDFLGNAYIANWTDYTVTCLSPSNYTDSSLCPGSPPYLGSAGAGGQTYRPTDILIDLNQNIWLASSNGSGAEDYETIVQLTRGSNYSTVNTYTVNAGGAFGSPHEIAMDYMGDIWVTNIGGGFGLGSTITCLDASNSFNYCAGPAFNAYGQISLSSGAGPVGIAIDNNDDIWVATLFGGVSHIDRDQNFSRTDYSVAGLLWAIAVDDNNDIFVSEMMSNELNCLDSSNSYSACSGFPKNIGAAISGQEVLNGLSVDSNNDIWIASEADDKVYCLDSSNSYNNCANTPILVGDLGDGNSPQPASMGDPTGRIMKKLFEASGGEGDVTVNAEVDPILTFDIVDYSSPSTDTNVCDIGALTVGQVSTCAYRIGAGTNGTNGFQIYIDDISTYSGMTANGGQDSLSDVTDYNVDGSGSTEEYGFIVSSTPNGILANGTYSTNEQAIPTSETAFINTSAPYDYTKGTAAETTVIDHKAVIDAFTETGYYTQVIQYTVVGKF